jgi:hypothetical protein
MPIELSKREEVLDNTDVSFLLVKFKGVFDYEGLYKMMHAWLISKRFLFHEPKYKDKVSTPFGNEIEINWDCEKKVTEFIREWIHIEFHMWDFSEVEVIKDGKKTKAAKTRMEIKFSCQVELDYSKKFTEEEGPSFAKKLGQFYVQHVIYWDWRIKYANVLEYSLYDLQTKVKKFLNSDTGSNAY